MNHYLAISLVLAAVLVAAARFNWKKWWYRNDVQVAPAASPRLDLKFAFYGCGGLQVQETRGSVNMLFESQWEGLAQTVNNIRSAGVDVILDVSPQLFVRGSSGKYTTHPNASGQLTALFNTLRSEGLLSSVRVLYPIDEPNNTVGDQLELARAVNVLRGVSSGFAELAGYKLATTYAADKDFIGSMLFDWIGFDDYDMKSSVLVGSKYKSMVASLLPGQQTMIIPGAAYGQDPIPFLNYAQTHNEVALVMPFLWCDTRQADVGSAGARSNGMAAQYLSAGKSVMQHN